MSLTFAAALAVTLAFLALAAVSVHRGSRPYIAPARHVASSDQEVSDPTDTSWSLDATCRAGAM